MEFPDSLSSNLREVLPPKTLERISCHNLEVLAFPSSGQVADIGIFLSKFKCFPNIPTSYFKFLPNSLKNPQISNPR